MGVPVAAERHHRSRRSRPPATPRLRVHAARLDGGTVRWAEAGTGRPLLLLHGLGETLDTWRPVASTLARSHRVIALDLPGRGGSTPADPSARPLLTARAEFVEHFLAGVGAGAQAIDIVGHSLGGALGLRLALRRPHRVRRLVMVSPAGASAGVPAWWRLAALQRPVRLAVAPLLLVTPRPLIELAAGTAFRLAALRRPWAADGAVVRRFARNLSTRRQVDLFLETAFAAVSELRGGLPHDVDSLRAEVLVVWGRHDRLMPVRDAAPLVAALPGSPRLLVMDGCGHCPQLERPSDLAAALLAFLDAPDATLVAARPAADPSQEETA